MSRADDYGFSDENKGLSSFVTLVKILQDLREPEADSGWATYLTCVSVMPGAGPKPTHPFYLPLGFPLDGPPQPLPKETAKSLERRFATLRGLRKQLEDSLAASGQPDAELKAYVITTGAVFGLLTLSHGWRFIEEGPDLATNPWYVLITVAAAALCLWACRLLWLAHRGSKPYGPADEQRAQEIHE